MGRGLRGETLALGAPTGRTNLARRGLSRETSLIGYGMLAYVLVVLRFHRRSTQISVLLGAALLIMAVGVSRLYLGVHYFSEVVGGYAAGLLWPAGQHFPTDVAAGAVTVFPNAAATAPDMGELFTP